MSKTQGTSHTKTLAKCPRREEQQGLSLYRGNVWNVQGTERRPVWQEHTGPAGGRYEVKLELRQV